MPIVGDAKKVQKSMEKTYGAEKAKSIFYATANKQGRKAENWKKKPKTAQDSMGEFAENAGRTLSDLWHGTPKAAPAPAPVAAPAATGPDMSAAHRALGRAEGMKDGLRTGSRVGGTIGAIGGAAGMGSIWLLTHLLKKRRQRKVASDFTGETADPGFAAALESQQNSVSPGITAAANTAQADALRTPDVSGSKLLPPPAAAAPAPVVAPKAAPIPPPVLSPQPTAPKRPHVPGSGPVGPRPPQPGQQPKPRPRVLPGVKSAAYNGKKKQTVAGPTGVNAPARFADTATSVKKLAAVLKKRKPCCA